ncbi:MAG: hypothetical protein KC613_20045 [Myxococcales bacterium]|nr:hypothetical protein [Myxococcales bacterium]
MNAVLLALLLAAPPVRGVALAPHFEGERTVAQVQARVDEIAATGANWVQLVVQWGQREVRSVDIAPYRWGTDDGEIRALARHARAKGLKVFIFPVLRLEAMGPGDWRGTLRPADRAAWWAAYRRFILHYAALARDVGAELFSVGSELGSLEGDLARWTGLVAAVRAVYPGRLTYSANWDHFHEVGFWPALDVVGINGYFPLSRRDDASEAELRATWAFIRDRILAWRPKDKPLMFTEIGYPSVVGAARRPYHYGGDGALDLEAQRRAYAAFVSAWGEEPALAGVFVWAWTGPGGPQDKGYGLRGKPALGILRAWFGR